MKSKRQALTAKQTFEIYKYLDENKESLNGLPRHKVFEKVQESVSFTMSQKSVSRICLQLGIEPSRRRQEKPAEKREGLEGALLDILDCIDDLAGIIENERNAAHCKDLYKKVEAIKMAVG